MGSIKDSAKKLVSEWSEDSDLLKQKKDNMTSTRKQVDEATSEQTMSIVKAMFKSSIIDAQDKLMDTTRSYWHDRAQEYRESMIRLITGSDALSERQRNELSEIILNYPDFQYDDDSDKVFIKAKYLRVNLLGNLFGWRERLDTKRLASSYNTKIKRNVSEMSVLINSNCFDGFKLWQEKLQSIIEENITVYNPELRELSEYIRDETDRINSY